VGCVTRLAAALKEDPDCNAIELDKTLGESVIASQGALEDPVWKWPER